MRIAAASASLALMLAGVAAVAGAPAASRADEVERIRACVEANGPRSSSVLKIGLEVRDAAGEQTRAEFKLYWRRLRDGERRVLIRFAQPADLAGAALLVEGVRAARPRVHLYLPELGKPRRVTSREQVDGFLGRADLGLDEIGQLLDPLGSETLRLLESAASLGARTVWVVESRPESEDPSRYARTVTFVDQELCVPLRAEFYRGEGPPARLLEIDPAQVTREAQSWIARELVFSDADSEARTTLRIREAEVDVPLAPSLLSVPALAGMGG